MQELQTVDVVKSLIAPDDTAQLAEWQAVEFDIHIAVKRTSLNEATGDEKEQIAAELKGLVQGMLGSRLQDLVQLQQQADSDEAAEQAALDEFSEDCCDANKAAVVATKQAAKASRKSANVIVGSAGILVLLAGARLSAVKWTERNYVQKTKRLSMRSSSQQRSRRSSSCCLFAL